MEHDQSKDSLVKSRHLAKIMKFEWKIPEAWLIKILRLLQLMWYYTQIDYYLDLKFYHILL